MTPVTLTRQTNTTKRKNRQAEHENKPNTKATIDRLRNLLVRTQTERDQLKLENQELGEVIDRLQAR